MDGTKAVIAAAVQVGVPKLVFTSSAGVVFNGEHLINVDERLPYPENAFDAYNESKAKAEQAVLEANGKGGLLTVAIRPAGIFGYVVPLSGSTPVNHTSVLVTVRPSLGSTKSMRMAKATL